MKASAYQLEKLAKLSAENRAAVDDLKLAASSAKPEDVLAVLSQARRIKQRLKEQRRLERALGLHKKPADGAA